MSENEDKYHDTVLDLEARAKKNEDVVYKIGNSLQGMFMLGPKPMSFYDSKVKHGLGYTNPYTLQKEISQNPKLYDASCLDDSRIHVNVRDTEDILDDATKSQIKMKKKSQDPITIEKKQNVWTIDYKELNALYEDFVPQKELMLNKHISHLLLYLLKILQMQVHRLHLLRQNQLWHQCQTSPTKKKEVETNQNVIAPGMYKVTKQQETNTKRAKSVLPSKGLSVASSVRRPLNSDSPLKNSVLSNTRKSSKKVEVSVRTNKETYVASKNVVSNKNIVVQIVLWIVNSGCSKHMTGDRSLLENFVMKFMGTIRFGNDHFTAITGYGDYVQGNITICHVYYVEGLGHNLFSVGQFCDEPEFKGYGPENSEQESNVVCDKKSDNSKENSDESLVEEQVSQDKSSFVESLLNLDKETVFPVNKKLPDENQILFKILKKDNMYNFDMKNIVPKESLTYLVAKATLDESMLWHRRLGHINFKNINKLVKDNLVRGLPTKRFENDQTCVACLKGKQHRASCTITNDSADSLNNENAEQERFINDSSTKDVNAVGQQVNIASPDVNTSSLKLNVVGPSVNTASSNEHDSPKDMFTMGVSSIL
ncbi:integrase, catalytic region, zinc finger, CCHC-type containing protein [Tanacetum coccineum]